MAPSPDFKSHQDAILLHHQQAQFFEDRHSELSRGEVFAGTFNFGRSRLMKIFDQWLPPVASPVAFLDVGCGTGHDLLHWSARGYSCSGVEPADGMIEVARKLNPALRIEQATVSCLPFPDSSFDVVIAIEVLRYLDNEHAALAEMLRVIKPGGQLIFTATSPVSLCLFPLINQISGRIKLPTLIHLLQHFHSVSSLRRMLVSNGADLVEVKGAGFVTALHLLGDRLLPSRWMEGIYRWCSPLEDRLSRHSQLAGLSLHMAIRAVKCNPGSASAR